MNILVTGANGQLGREIRKIVDAMGNGQPNHNVGEKNYYIFAGHSDLDITDAEACKKYVSENHINVVVNCAAYTAVDKAEDEEATAYQINAIGAKSLADAVKQNGGVLIHISTDYVFDGAKNSIYMTTDATNPQSAYGRTKLAGENFIEESGCNYIILRTSWLYGGETKNFVKTMFNLIQTKDEIKVVNDQEGNPTYVVDLANFICYIIENNDNETRYLSKYGVYHFSNVYSTTWYGLTTYIKMQMERCMGKKFDCNIIPCTTEDYPTKAKRPKNSSLCTTLLEISFDYLCEGWRTSLENCIRKYIKEIKI